MSETAQEMKLNDKERNIVNLINQLSEYANDETTTKDAVDRILGEIRSNTNESIQNQLDVAEQLKERPKPQFPQDDMMHGLKESIDGERAKLMREMLSMPNDDEHKVHVPAQPQGQLLFTRIREVKKPGKAHPTDAGIDFYVPDEKSWDEDFKALVEKYAKNPNPDMVHFETVPGEEYGKPHPILVVEPNAHVAIPSGIKTIIPQGLGIMFVNKSGIATKLKLDHSACLVDSEYRDELIMCFFNHGTVPAIIEPGMKMTQGLVVPIIDLELTEVLNCVYDDMGKDSNRGGGFGSSGR